MKLLFVCLVAALLIGSVTAAPTTQVIVGAATSNSATLSMGGVIVDPCWFEWGQLSGSLSWKTPNRTSAGGLSTYQLKGSPLNGNTKFYYRACDSTGCDPVEMSFTTLAVTPMPTTTYTEIFNNLTENGLDPQFMAMNAVAPYAWILPGFDMMIWFLLFFAIFVGLVLTGRGMGIPVIMGLLSAGFIFSPIAGLYLGIPPELQSVAQGVMYAALAGVVVGLIKK